MRKKLKAIWCLGDKFIWSQQYAVYPNPQTMEICKDENSKYIARIYGETTPGYWDHKLTGETVNELMIHYPNARPYKQKDSP